MKERGDDGGRFEGKRRRQKGLQMTKKVWKKRCIGFSEPGGRKIFIGGKDQKNKKGGRENTLILVTPGLEHKNARNTLKEPQALLQLRMRV